MIPGDCPSKSKNRAPNPRDNLESAWKGAQVRVGTAQMRYLGNSPGTLRQVKRFYVSVGLLACGRQEIRKVSEATFQVVHKQHHKIQQTCSQVGCGSSRFLCFAYSCRGIEQRAFAGKAKSRRDLVPRSARGFFGSDTRSKRDLWGFGSSR